jgi:hypothetical protein
VVKLALAAVSSPGTLILLLSDSRGCEFETTPVRWGKRSEVNPHQGVFVAGYLSSHRGRGLAGELLLFFFPSPLQLDEGSFVHIASPFID